MIHWFIGLLVYLLFGQNIPLGILDFPEPIKNCKLWIDNILANNKTFEQ